MQQSESSLEIAQITEPPTFAGLAKNRIMAKLGMSEDAWAIYDAEVSIGLLSLRTAFPAQARNYSGMEHDMLTALWLEIFAGIKPGMLQEAIMRFVATDRKGFFPSPGQVMGIVEDMQAERDRLEDEERNRKHCEHLREVKRRIESGENCLTCRFCECREAENKPDSGKHQPRLFCQNPQSYKYEGRHGHGTAADILCEHYEQKYENEVNLSE